MDNDIRKLIWDRAKKYYPVKASHGLNHIQDNLNMAKKMLDFAKEPLTDQIYAAIVFHDSGLEKYGREIHEVHSAEIAKRELKDLFNSKDLFLIAAAIREHRASFKGEFTSMLSDICSSADRNAPNFEASVARSFLYTSEHHPEFSFEEKCETVAMHLKKKYGSNGYARFPIYYSRYYGKDLTNYKRKMDGLNAAVVERIVGKDGKNASKIYDASMEGYYETATEISGDYNQWIGEYMYHGSSSKFTTLEPQIRNNRTTSTTKPKIFFTPFKGFAGFFCIDQNDELLSVFGSDYDKESIVVLPKEMPVKDKDGNYDLSQFQQVDTNIAYRHNVKEFKSKFTKRFVGYIHFVKTDKLISSGLQEHVFHGMPEYWYYKSVQVDKVERVEITATFEYDSQLSNKVGVAALEEMESIKKITFPPSEIDTIKKQDRIITTRVSTDYDKFHEGDLVETPWKAIYKVAKRLEITSIEKHPYYSELTKQQIAYLSKQDKIAVLTLEKQFDKLELEKVKNPSGDELSLILEGINLAADASNDPKWTMQDLRKYLEVKPNIFFIKKEEEKIGIVFLGIDGGHNEIGNFAIFKKYQGKGYGLQALKVIIDYLRKLHPGKDIEIGVAEKNTKAVNLYKKVGFKITKTGEEKSGRFYRMTLDAKTSVSMEALSDKVASNIVNDKVYHASPKKFDVISGKKSNTPNAKSSVFVSPFKHFASMFILDFQGIVDQIEEQIGKKHIKIDNFGFMEWNETPRSTTSIPSKVHVLVRTPENFKPFKGKATGYMYTIDFSKYKDQANMWSKAKDSDVEFTIHGDVKPEKCEQISYEYEVLKDTKQYNHAEESMSNTAQENFGVKDDTFVRDVILPAIKDDTLYHGSSQKLSIIKPFQLKELRDKNVKTISLTPYARLASLFCVPFRSIRENDKGQVIFHHCRMKLDEWFEYMPEDEMYKSVQTVHVSHNIKQLEPIDKTYTGYLHYVHAEDALVDAGANPINGKGPYEVVSYVKELKPYKVETIKIRMIAKYSPSFAKECGLDAEPCEPEDVATESLTIEPDINPKVRVGLENFWDESKPIEYRGRMDVNGVEHLHFVHGDETNQALSVMVVHSRERKDNCGPVRVVYEFDKSLVGSTVEQTDLDVAAELLQEFNAGIEEFNTYVRNLELQYLKNELNDEQVAMAFEHIAMENVIADTVKGIFKKIGEFISWFLRKLKDLWNYFFGKTQRATRALKAANDKITRHKNSNGFFNDAAFESAQAPQNLVNAVGLDSFVNMGFVPDAFNAIFNEMLNMWANEPQDLYEEVFVKYNQAPTTHRWHPIVAFMPTGGPNSTDAIAYTKNRYKSVGSMRDSAYDRDSVLILLEEVMKVIEAYEKNSKLIATKGNIASEAAKRTMEYQDRTDVTEHEAIQMAKDIQELGNYLQVVFKCYQKAFEFILEQTGIVTGIYMKYMK